MDPTDEKILAILKEDARRPHVEIAKHVNLSEAAVRRRLSNLVKNGIISKFTIETTVGKQASALTFASVSSSFPTSDVSGRLRHVKGIDAIFEITGEYDVAVILSGSNIAEINRVIEDIRKMDGVKDTNTVMVLKTVR